jgi:transposase InsO family protein
MTLADRAAWRAAVVAFTTPYSAETNLAIQKRVERAVADGMLPGPVPHLGTLWMWLKPVRAATATATRAALAALGTTGTCATTAPASLAELAPPEAGASHAALIAQVAALATLVDALRDRLAAAHAMTPDLLTRHRNESKWTGKALKAETSRRGGPWSAKGLWTRIAALRELARTDERALQTVSEAERRARSASPAGSSLVLASTGTTPVATSASTREHPSESVALVRRADDDRLPIYHVSDDAVPWVEELERIPFVGLGVVIGAVRRQKQRDDAAARLDLLAPVLSGTLSPDEAATAWRALFRGEPACEEAAWLCPPAEEFRIRYREISGRTLRKWAAKVTDARRFADEHKEPRNDLDALMHRQPDDVRGPRALSLKVIQALQEQYKNTPNYSAALICALASEQGVEVSERTVQRWIARIPDLDRGLSRGGIAARDELFRFRLIREAPYPNRAWIMDHSFFKLEEYDRTHPEWADGVASGKRDFDLAMEALLETESVGAVIKRKRIRKVTMTVIMDACTRRILAIRLWAGVPSTHETLLALRDAMERFGTPEILYTDNGSDLTAHAVRDAVRLAGIRHVFSLPYCPEGRGKIERVMRTIKERILATLPGYRGKRHTTEVSEDELLLLSEIERRVWARVDQWMNGTTHSETGRVPSAHYDEMIGARGLLGQPPLAGLLLSLLCVRVEARVGTDGARANGRRYAGPGLMALPMEARVAIYSDPYRPRVAWIGVQGEDGLLYNNGPVKVYGPNDPAPNFVEWNELSAAWTVERDKEVAANRSKSQAKSESTRLRTAAVRSGVALANDVGEVVKQLQTAPPRRALTSGAPPVNTPATAGSDQSAARGSDDAPAAPPKPVAPAMHIVERTTPATAGGETATISGRTVLADKPPAPKPPTREPPKPGALPWDKPK